MIVDIDSHISEPMDVFERLLEAPYRSRRPRIIEDTRGFTRILLEGRLYPDPRLKQVPERKPGLGPAALAASDYSRGIVGCRGEIGGMHAGAADAAARLQALDLEGIDTQVVFGNLGLVVSALADKDFAAAMSRACNNYYAEFCAHDPARQKPMATLPLQDIPAAVAELRRAIGELGHAGVALPSSVNGKNLDHPDLFPVFEAAQELKAPVAVHWGNAAYLAAAGADRFDSHLMTHLTGHPFEQMIAVSCVLCGGVLDEFPRLRFAFLEAGCGWVPYWIERIQEHRERRRAEVPLMKRDALEYLRSGRCYFGTEPDEAMLPAVTNLIGDDLILFGSDYPHADSKFPGTVSAMKGRRDLSGVAVEKILGRNAMNYLGLSVREKSEGTSIPEPVRV